MRRFFLKRSLFCQVMTCKAQSGEFWSAVVGFSSRHTKETSGTYLIGKWQILAFRMTAKWFNLYLYSWGLQYGWFLHKLYCNFQSPFLKEALVLITLCCLMANQKELNVGQCHGTFPLTGRGCSGRVCLAVLHGSCNSMSSIYSGFCSV